jgi:GNAT superfamily N-acetyltransferase
VRIIIRRGKVEDAERICELLVAGSLEFIVGDFSDEGRRYFLGQLTPEHVTDKLAGDFRFYLAGIGGTLSGVAAIRANTHLYYLFVAKAFQRRGVARRLWEAVRTDAIRNGNSGVITVSASKFAVAIYEHLGFVQKGPEQESKGVPYIPMEHNLGS